MTLFVDFKTPIELNITILQSATIDKTLIIQSRLNNCEELNEQIIEFACPIELQEKLLSYKVKKGTKFFIKFFGYLRDKKQYVFDVKPL